MKELTDAEVARMNHLYKFMDHTAKSGWVDVRPIIQELGEILGVHPSTIEPALRKQLREFGI